MTATQSLNLYNIAFKYFKNESDAMTFVKEIEVVVDNKFDNKKDVLSTKEDLAIVKGELQKGISDSKVEIIKWVFAFFATLALMIVGLYIKK